MPQNTRIWQVSDTGSLSEISKTRLDSEAKLEEWLETDIGMIGDDLLVIGRGPEPAVALVMGADALGGAEFADSAHGFRGFAGQTHRFLAAANLLKRQKFGPPAEDETAIATAGAGAAHVFLDHDNIEGRVLLFEIERRPQSGEATADNANIGAYITNK